MTLKLNLSSLVPFALVLLLAYDAYATPISITSSTVYARANDVTASDTNTDWGTRTLTAVDGNATTTVTMDWSSSAGGATLDFDVRTNGDSRSGLVPSSRINFISTRTVTYSLSGLFSLQNGSVDVFLRNFDTNAALYGQFVDGSATDLALGAVIDERDRVVGNLTGILQANVAYQLFINSRANGQLSLDLNGAPPVTATAPPSAALMLCALVLVGLRQRRAS